MNKVQIQIRYDTYYDNWINTIKIALDCNGINYNDNLLKLIFNSLVYSVQQYLLEMGYKPRNKFVYRQGLVKKLKHDNLYLQIQSNNLLWLYLDYFTDLEDYSKCFDIQIVTYTQEQTLEERILNLKHKMDKCNDKYITELIDIVYELIKKENSL